MGGALVNLGGALTQWSSLYTFNSLNCIHITMGSQKLQVDVCHGRSSMGVLQSSDTSTTICIKRLLEIIAVDRKHPTLTKITAAPELACVTCCLVGRRVARYAPQQGLRLSLLCARIAQFVFPARGTHEHEQRHTFRSGSLV